MLKGLRMLATCNVQVQFAIEDEDRPTGFLVATDGAILQEQGGMAGTSARVIVLNLDRATDCILMPWDLAYQLADLMQQVIDDARCETDPIDPAQLLQEQSQIKVGVWQSKVFLQFPWGDRFRYHWRSLQVLQQALRIKAQDVQFAERQVLMPTLTVAQGKRLRKLRR